MILRGAALKEREIERVKDQAKVHTNGSLAILLPKLKKTHDFANQDVNMRQEKIISIMKGERLGESTSAKSRKFFGSEFKSSKTLNKDLPTHSNQGSK